MQHSFRVRRWSLAELFRAFEARGAGFDRVVAEIACAHENERLKFEVEAEVLTLLR
jgi:hypothetical protein